MAVLVKTKRKTDKVALNAMEHFNLLTISPKRVAPTTHKEKTLSEILSGRTLSEAGGAALEQHILESRNEWDRNF